MGLDQIRRDIMHLAGHLAHRSALSSEERLAAEFIEKRFQEYSPQVAVDVFQNTDCFHYIFASYYSEFLLISILALWWPAFAVCYGLAVLLMYLAEFMGYHLISRLMPQYQSQNVVAQFESENPTRLIVITAHYDSGRASSLTDPAMLPWLRPLHWGLLACMALIVATCGADAIGSLTGTESAYTQPLRWCAVAPLLLAAFALFRIPPNSADVRGANNNASGVAALLRLAERLAAKPVDGADVWLVATGSNESWMGGAHHLVSTHRLPKSNVCVLNIESVGAGSLHYLTGEGMLQYLPSDREMVEAAAAAAAAHNATPAELRSVPTAIHGMLARGHRGMSIIGLNEDRLPPHWHWHTDRICEVDEPSVANAANFAEAVLRTLAAPAQG